MRVATDQTHAVVVQSNIDILYSSVPLLPLDSLVAGGESEKGGWGEIGLLLGETSVQCESKVCSVRCVMCSVSVMRWSVCVCVCVSSPLNGVRETFLHVSYHSSLINRVFKYNA